MEAEEKGRDRVTRRRENRILKAVREREESLRNRMSVFRTNTGE